MLQDLEPAVATVNLTKVYLPTPPLMRILLTSAINEPVAALTNVSIQVQPGEICAIVGANGAGKSTLFRILTGLTTPSSGQATICGHDASRAPRAVRSLVGFVPAGDQSLYLRLSCFDNLVFHAQLAGYRRRAINHLVHEVLELVDLDHAAHRVGFALSAGMRARLLLARALLHRPRVLILDEPTATIDPVGAYELLQSIQQLAKEEEVAVLLSSHRLEEIEALGRRLILMDHGSIIFDGSLDALSLQSTRRAVTMLFSKPSSRASAMLHLSSRFGQVELLHDPEYGPTQAAIVTEHGVGALIAALGDELDDLVAIEEIRPPLREVIYSVLRREPPESPS